MLIYNLTRISDAKVVATEKSHFHIFNYIVLNRI